MGTDERFSLTVVSEDEVYTGRRRTIWSGLYEQLTNLESGEWVRLTLPDRDAVQKARVAARDFVRASMPGYRSQTRSRPCDEGMYLYIRVIKGHVVDI